MTERLNIIKTRLQEAFSPTLLVVEDESSGHRGHGGYDAKGSHFYVRIQAACFSRMSRVEAHRRIYSALADMMPHEIHALRIEVEKE